MDTSILGEWSLAIGIIIVITISVVFVRTGLRKLGKKGRWVFLSHLAAAVSNLIYIVGLRMFAEVAPLTPKLRSWFEDMAYVLGVVILLGLLRRIALEAMEWGALRSNRSRTLQQGFIPLMRNLVTLFVFFSGGIMVLKHFNYDVISLLTALGVGSLAVGLAAKETLSNMISGFTLIIDQNLSPGDRINLGGLSGSVGDVEEIGLRSTRIRTAEGNVLIVPNTELVNTKILNLSLPSREALCSTAIRVSYSVAFSKIKEACAAVFNEIKSVHRDRGVSVHLASLNEGHQLITIGFWVVDMDQSAGVVSQFNEKLLSRLASDSIRLLSPGASG